MRAPRARAQRTLLMLDASWQPLAPLLAGAQGVDRVVTSEDMLADEGIVARASVLSLPHLLNATPASLPNTAYLAAPAERRAVWAARLEGVMAARGQGGRGNGSRLTELGDGNHCPTPGRRL